MDLSKSSWQNLVHPYFFINMQTQCQQTLSSIQTFVDTEFALSQNG